MNIMRFTICTMLLILAAGSALAQERGQGKGAPAGPGLTLTTAAFSDGELEPKRRVYRWILLEWNTRFRD